MKKILRVRETRLALSSSKDLTINSVEGFTLTELLIVIGILATLSTIVFFGISTTVNRIRTQQAKMQLEKLRSYIQIAQGATGLPLKDITGYACCVCPGRILTGITENDGCYTQWLSRLTKIKNAMGESYAGLNIAQFYRDPWGSPYNMDENEREFSSIDCRPDTFGSVGPDGKLSTSDDLMSDLPFSSGTCP